MNDQANISKQASAQDVKEAEMHGGIAASLDAAPLHIGTRLEKARKSLGLSLEDAGHVLRIQPKYLGAIERLDKSALPSVGYVLGYIKTYAGHLGLDGEEAVAAYKLDSEVPENLGMRSAPHFVPKRHIRLPRGFFPATTTLACAAILAVWYASNTDAQSSALTRVSEITAQPFIEPAQPTDPNLMTIKATAPSWIEIKDNRGKVIISRILVVGESWQADMHSGVTLSARDGGALELYLGDELMGALGAQGMPMQNIPMPAVLPEFMTAKALERQAAEDLDPAAQAGADAPNAALPDDPKD